MRYQAPLNLKEKLLSLRADYEAITKVDFSTTNSKFTTFFGAKDIATRLKQIQIIEAIATTVDPLSKHNERDSYFDQYHLMVAIAHITMQQIRGSSKVCPIGSELYKLLNDALGIDSKNSLDQHTINECMFTLRHCDKSKINRVLRASGVKELTESEWQEYKGLASAETELNYQQSDSPVADSLSYVGGLVLRPVGWGIGFAFGKTIGRTGTSGPAKAALTGAISSVFIFLGPIAGGGAAAATLLARPHAEDAIVYAAGYGAAQLCGSAFRKVGRGLGWVIGKGVDLAIDATSELAGKTYELISDGQTVELDLEIGLDLVDKELTANSKHHSQEDLVARIMEVVSEQIEATENVLEKGDSDLIQPKVLSFSISESEQALLPQVLKTLGYINSEKNEGLLQTAATELLQQRPVEVNKDVETEGSLSL